MSFSRRLRVRFWFGSNRVTDDSLIRHPREGRESHRFPGKTQVSDHSAGIGGGLQSRNYLQSSPTLSLSADSVRTIDVKCRMGFIVTFRHHLDPHTIGKHPECDRLGGNLSEFIASQLKMGLQQIITHMLEVLRRGYRRKYHAGDDIENPDYCPTSHNESVLLPEGS